MDSKFNNFYDKYESIVDSVKNFLSSSWISIFVILIVIVLLTQMDQGGTLIIHLLSNPLDVFLLIFLTTSLSLVVSHYPDYFTKHVNNTTSGKKEIQWEMKFKLFCVGLITYNNNARNNETIRRANLMKRLLGTLLLSSVVYILFTTYELFINPNINSNWISTFVLIFSIFHYILLYRQKKTISYKEKLARYLGISFWISIITGILPIVASYYYGWSKICFWFLVIHYISLIITYNLFRNSRFFLKFSKHAWPIRFLSEDLVFIGYMAFSGIIALGIFIYSQFDIDSFNPIIIVLSILYIIYGLIVIPIKHNKYYKYMRKKDEKKSFCLIPEFVFLYITPLSLILLLSLSLFAIEKGNDLHKLNLVDEYFAVSETEFISKIVDKFKTDNDTLYFIASYGGGLTANTWNCLVMDSLSNFKCKNNILDNTVAISGVSGGAMGQGLYMGIRKNHDERIKRKQIIENMGTKNFLSLDLSWMFGRDFIREWNTVENFDFDKDRAKKSLLEYSEIIEDPSILEKSFREYYKEIFDKNYYPALLMNSASTHSTRGISCSIKLDSFKKVFPGADDMLTFNSYPTKSLSYADALSTTNRFPFLSPAAKIEGRGHYIDGGYFENSGMLSLYNFYKYLSADKKWRDSLSNKKIVFIQIMNSKSNQIHEILRKYDERIIETKESGEIAAVINTITSIAGLPWYLSDYITQDTNIFYKPIILPYHLEKSDFENILKAKTINWVDLINEIAINNSSVDSIRNICGDNWKSAEPPLARLVSKPAVNYMKAAIRKGSVFDELFKECDSLTNE